VFTEPIEVIDREDECFASNFIEGDLEDECLVED
jgi:hypothetical protein